MINHEERLYHFLCNLDKKMREQNLLQKHVAFEAEVADAYINKILYAIRKPGFDLIWSIADALKIKPGELMDPVPSPEELLDFKQALTDKKLGSKERRNKKIDAGEQHQRNTSQSQPEEGFNIN
ncbi:helix-turn-helix protein [Chitinophaga dinghuensis]|uniref:Helix-turn-helix protein n=1 Tax=Chitinophaga dinghuensis TaxID=1539050 RepID=A0A327VJY5_9BACT|nr:helix-turn-helix transcriptional regulator [Chitinophaga dinghuensis]RAJ75020.1 helix-turn-helix protein [Chitinophaga dinghuensis]